MCARTYCVFARGGDQSQILGGPIQHYRHLLGGPTLLAGPPPQILGGPNIILKLLNIN